MALPIPAPVAARTSQAARSEDTAQAARSEDTAGWVFAGLLVPIHLFWVTITVGLRFDHVLMDGLAIGLFFSGPKVSAFAWRVLPLWLVGALYETLLPTLMPLRGTVHVADVYQLELAWFGIGEGAARVVPSTWMVNILHPVLDLICGLTYLAYLPQIFLFAAYSYARYPKQTATLLWSFMVLNLLGWATWILLPAAPPWYVELYGLDPARLGALPSEARGARFDAVLGLPIFHAFYTRSVNVFGALPSLHCAYPTLVLLVAIGLRRPVLVVPAALFVLLMCFSAVYLDHHYLVDVLAGVAYALITFAAVTAVQRWRGGRTQA